MALTKLTATLNQNQAQPDEPAIGGPSLKLVMDTDVNTIKDYINDDLTAEIDTALSERPTNSEAVLAAGDQTIAGVKTFTSSPVIPDAVNANEPATKGQLDGVVAGDITDNSLSNAKLAIEIKVGNLPDLDTDNKDSVTDAINEVNANADSNTNHIGISNRVYTGSISGSDVTISTDGDLTDSDFGVPVQFKLAANVTSATLQIDSSSVYNAKDLNGDAMSFRKDTIYIAYLVDDTTDFFESAPRCGGGIKAIYQEFITTTPTVIGTTSDIDITKCVVDGKVYDSGGDARNSTGYITLSTSGSDVRISTSDGSVMATVTEFENPSAIETDLVTLTASTTNVTLTNTYDTSKPVLVTDSYYHPGTDISYAGMVRCELTSSTNLEISSTGTAGGANYGTVRYYVVQI